MAQAELEDNLELQNAEACPQRKDGRFVGGRLPSRRRGRAQRRRGRERGNKVD